MFEHDPSGLKVTVSKNFQPKGHFLTFFRNKNFVHDNKRTISR